MSTEESTHIEQAKGKIELELLKSGVLGLSEGYGSACFEAAVICLNKFDHLSGCSYKLSGDLSGPYSLNWESELSSGVDRSWQDDKETLSFGATGVALIISNLLTEHKVLLRSCTGTGIDYWLGEDGEDGMFQQKDRLEISGILEEKGNNTLRNRLRIKHNQTKRSAKSRLPSIVIVTEFKSPKGIFKRFPAV